MSTLTTLQRAPTRLMTTATMPRRARIRRTITATPRPRRTSIPRRCDVHDPSHDHSHAEASSHEHSHAEASHEHSHDAATCTDPSHDHSHDAATCTDPTHDHSHDDARQETTAATRFGIRTFVYTRRRPFVGKRFEALLSELPFEMLEQKTTRALSVEESDAPEGTPFGPVLRSSRWLQSENQVAMYFAGGKQIEVSEMGKWWRRSTGRSGRGARRIDPRRLRGRVGRPAAGVVFIGANMDQGDRGRARRVPATTGDGGDGQEAGGGGGEPNAI